MRMAGYQQPFLVCTTREAASRYSPIVTAAGGTGATTSILDVFDFVEAATNAA